jgi:hypothetical protein
VPHGFNAVRHRRAIRKTPERCWQLDRHNANDCSTSKKWIAEAVREADAKTYGISVSEIENYERFAIIDRAVELIDRSYGDGCREASAPRRRLPARMHNQD